jgi:hypothetical protein
VNAERVRLHELYVPLRLKILDHYLAAAQLVGLGVGRKEHKLPPKLGHWHHTHSDLVLGVCPELLDVVNTIEGLCLARDPNFIRGKHKRQRPGPKPGWQRTGPLNTQAPYQVGGEYRDGKL